MVLSEWYPGKLLKERKPLLDSKRTGSPLGQNDVIFEHVDDLFFRYVNEVDTLESGVNSLKDRIKGFEGGWRYSDYDLLRAAHLLGDAKQSLRDALDKWRKFKVKR